MLPVKNPFGRFVIYLTLTIYVSITSLPFLWTVLQSLKNLRQANARPPLFIFKPTFESYTSLWFRTVPKDLPWLMLGFVVVNLAIIVSARAMARRDASRLAIVMLVLVSYYLLFWAIPQIVKTADFYDFFVNTVIVTVGTVIIAVSVSSLGGYALARYGGISGAMILIVALAFQSLPVMAFALPYFQLATVTGLQDSYVLLIMVLVGLHQPFALWMLRSFFMDIPQEIEEAAMVDGASRLTAFVRILIPIMWPGIVSTGLLVALGAYHEFLLVRVLTQLRWTLPVAITKYIGTVYSSINTVPYAAAVCVTVPLLILVLFFQEQLVKGLSSGAVKG
ncbi:MAG: carbohydrate ABC transporter permease [Herpetosiphonaceae bacterium]|nr:carbohydrate ABC transporter permease [Herpetosiphonaceae bacterium]